MKRREFIAGLGGAAAWPLAARAQQPGIPVIGFVNGGSGVAFTAYVSAFRKGLSEGGYVDGQNAKVEYHWLEGQYDRLPAVMADLVRRRVAVIATPGGDTTSPAAKAATAMIPIVFGVAQDPVKLGLVASLARPGGNATGFNFFNQEVVAKRLGLLHELVPEAVRIAVLVNPANDTTTRRHCGRRRKPHASSGCKSRSSTPARATRSMQPFRPLRASASKPCSSVPTAFSPAAPFSWPSWQRTTELRQFIRIVIMSQPVG
jgi:ABC transporter substrate binding protein